MKLFERISEIVDASVPKEQAGFRKRRNCCDQVLALTNFIKLGFEKNLNTGVVFIDLSYDIVWKSAVKP